MVASKSVVDKAKTYLSEGKITVKEFNPNGRSILFSAQGSVGTYTIEFSNGEKHWVCTCPAQTECAHIVAVKLICDYRGTATIGNPDKAMTLWDDSLTDDSK